MDEGNRVVVLERQFQDTDELARLLHGAVVIVITRSGETGESKIQTEEISAARVGPTGNLTVDLNERRAY